MTQPRIFVSYAPTSRSERTARARTVSRAKEPAIMVLAGALLASGAVHAVGTARSGAESQPAPTPRPPLGPAQWRPTPDALPYLAVASVDFAPAIVSAPPPKPASVIQTRQPQPRQMASPRRDLAGFLKDRGLTLAADELPVAAAIAMPVAPEEQAAELVVPPTSPPSGTLASVTESDPDAGQTALAEAQSFPTVTVDGQALGAVTMRGGKVHLGSLVGLLELKLPEAEFQRLQAAPAADSFVDLDTLRTAGISAAVDATGETITLTAGEPAAE